MKDNLYESDFYSWTKEQLRLLQNSNFDELDIENLKEEIKDLGNNIRDSITSHLKIILLHLLKWKYQEERRSKSWYLSVSNSRVEIEDILEDNPGLVLQQKTISFYHLNNFKILKKEWNLFHNLWKT